MNYIELLKKYEERLKPWSESEAWKLIEQKPWCLDYAQQGHTSVVKAIVNESQRYLEFFPRCQFSLLLHLDRAATVQQWRDFATSVSVQSWQRYELLVSCAPDVSSAVLEAIRAAAGDDHRIRILDEAKVEGVWTSLVDQAKGDYVVSCKLSALLHPQLLTLCFREIHGADTALDFIFTNHVVCDENFSICQQYVCKPELSLSMLQSLDYVGPCGCYRKTDQLRAAIQASAESGLCLWHGVQLVLAAAGASSRHLPLFAYLTKSRSQLNPALSKDQLRTWLSAASERYPQTIAPQKILVAIPYRDQVHLTIKCLKSLNKQTSRHQLTVVLVDNNSQDPETKNQLDQVLPELGDSLTVIRQSMAAAFNFAKLNNQAFAYGAGDHDLFLLLNNDVEFTTENTLEQMVQALLTDPKVGFVGIKLFYPDQTTVQHSGMVVDYSTSGAGFNNVSGVTADEEFPDADRLAAGVTFACAMTRVSTYQELGGLDELNFPNGFGDVALCMKAARLGYQCLYLGSVSAIHHESVSRTIASEDSEFYRLHELYAPELQSARLRRFGFNLQREALNQSPIADPASENSDVAIPQDLPLRYQLADRINNVAKVIAGPVHTLTRTLFAKRPS